jgi:murein DD-endopeptidase MepM/ murein hydrolase activator NlpD
VCAVLGWLVTLSVLDSSSAADHSAAAVEAAPGPLAEGPPQLAEWTGVEPALLLAQASSDRAATPPDWFATEGDLMTPAVVEPAEMRTVEGVLGKGETLARSLAERGVGAGVVDQIARGLKGHFDFRRSQPGHSYRLVQDGDGEFVAFDYRTSEVVSYTLHRDHDGSFHVARDEAELRPRNVIVAGIVTSSLYGAITDLGAEAQLATDFADVFAYDVDFSRMVRPGDEFRILYEQLYRIDEDGEEHFVRPGRILAARYGGEAGEHTAVYFEAEEGRGGYYRPDGSSVEHQFLMSPLRFARITSRYSAARKHPILKITRPHHGIDYAAPSGTPVFAVSGGKVVHKSWTGGFGNLVKIRHPNGYVSYYAHLSRFASGLHTGQPVDQKQVIGYVGSTGLATGPHVCFRVAKDGHYVNPARIPSPEGPPLPSEAQDSFRAHRDVMLAQLDSGNLVASDEAL